MLLSSMTCVLTKRDSREDRREDYVKTEIDSHLQTEKRSPQEKPVLWRRVNPRALLVSM